MMLKGERIKLRALELDDIEACWIERNNMEIMYFGNMGATFPSSKYSVHERLKRNMENKNYENGFDFGIEDENGKLIGTIGANFVDLKNRKLMLGISLNSGEACGKGYGTEAVKLFLEFAFKELNMHKVYLGVFSYNPRAKRSYEKCGFKVEAVARKRVFRDGQYFDEILMGILEDEYFENENTGR